MDLFEVRRYKPSGGGDDDAGSGGGTPAAAKDGGDLLELLKAKAAAKRSSARADAFPAKKRRGSAADGPWTEEPQLEQKTEQRSKKAKRAKLRRKANKTKSAAEEQEASAGGFTVLGEDLDKTKRKIRRVLPRWLSHPDVVSVDLSDQQMAVADLPGLDEETVANLRANGISHFFPVQRQIIPYLLKTAATSECPPEQAGGRLVFPFRPHDLCVSAPTGSGKTLAYVLPIVQALKDRTVPRVRALVLLPVQDLATQVYKVFQQYTRGTNLRVKLLSGQRSFAVEQSELVRPDMVGGHHCLVDVVVATPGRIVDHIQKTAGFSLQDLRYLIVDEADRVMEDIQNDWLAHVEGSAFGNHPLRRERPGPLNLASVVRGDGVLPLQKLLFSATLSQNPEKLDQMNLFEPKLFTSVVQPKDIILNKGPTAEGAPEQLQQQREGEFVGKYTTPAELEESFVRCRTSLLKPLILHHLIKVLRMKKALVFTGSIESSHKLAVLMRQFGDLSGVEELSSQVQKGRRNRVVNKFSSGEVDLMVCTDSMARGIDIDDIDFVVSYDCPKFVKTYIHRVGRTARAGRSGCALTLLDGRPDEKRFRSLMKEAGKEGLVKEVQVNEDELDLNLYEAAKAKAAEILGQEVHKKPTKTAEPGSGLDGSRP